MIRFRMEWRGCPGRKGHDSRRMWCRLVIDAGGRLVTESVHGPSESLRGGVYGLAFSALPVDGGELVVPAE